ncbi:MAG: carboxymuconolactone decarboxylase family protein [Polaromonas sp.]
MEQRINFYKASPDTMKALGAFEAALDKRGLDANLVNLVKLRASQINGCAYCVDLHARDLRKDGNDEHRLYTTAVWRETPFFSARERAALAWTESLTQLSDTHAPDADYQGLREHFTDSEIVDLTMVIGVINIWNRFGVGFRVSPKNQGEKA